MSARRVFDAVAPIEGALYQALLEVVAPDAACAGMIVRSDKVRLSPAAVGMLADLEPYLIGRAEVSSWPGSQLVGTRTSRRDVYAITQASLSIISRCATSLSAWVNPALPEDLHFLREDGSTILGSVAQHDDAWLELDTQEHEAFEAAAPELLRNAFRVRT